MKYKYLITSERAWRRSDERENVFTTNKKYEIGDVIELDGIKWTIEDEIKEA